MNPIEVYREMNSQNMIFINDSKKGSIQTIHILFNEDQKTISSPCPLALRQRLMSACPGMP